MREDIRLLGGILGDTVREQDGDDVFDLVERARVESFRVRRSEIDRADMAQLFDGIDVGIAIPVIRAFSHFALLANLAEDIHRERRRAVHVAAGEPPQSSSLAATYPKLDAAEPRRRHGRRSRSPARSCPRSSPRIPPRPAAARCSTPSTSITELMRLRAPQLQTRPPTRRASTCELRRQILIAVADRPDPVVPAADPGRDRNRPALLPRGTSSR